MSKRGLANCRLNRYSGASSEPDARVNVWDWLDGGALAGSLFAHQGHPGQGGAERAHGSGDLPRHQEAGLRETKPHRHHHRAAPSGHAR